MDLNKACPKDSFPLLWVDILVDSTVRHQLLSFMDAYLSSPPLLSPSKLGEELFLYLVVSPATVNVALVKEEDRVWKPMYYTS